MHIVKIPYDEQKVAEMWPSFKRSLEEKHGENGATGDRLEGAALQLIEEHMKPAIVIDHSQDVVGQFHGIDYTVYFDNGRTITVDVKGGRSGIYFDSKERYWYITIRDDFFIERKINSHFFHTGPKGDLYVFYNKKEMREWLDKHPYLLIPDKYGSRLDARNLPDRAKTNLSVF